MGSLSTAELKAIIKENGGVNLLNANGLFDSGVSRAKNALNVTSVPSGITVEALQAYREIATRNIAAEVQQIRVQAIDRLLGMMGK